MATARPSFALARPPTPLVGRRSEVAAIRALLVEDGVGLVTLTGPGGVGKTRLALEVAEEVGGHFADGVVVVDLSAVRDPDLVLPTIAQGIGVRETAERRLVAALSAYLRPRQLLLVLDNCEQILAAAPDIAVLGAASPALQILATSRSPLHVRGEQLLPIAPLPLPESGEAVRSVIARVDSVQLFLQRARAVHPGFAPTGDDVRTIAEICRRLDGLPLAIELAASWLKLLPPQALLVRLSDRLGLLTGGQRDLPDRQRTMRDTIAWSHDLLDDGARALFARLAVFSGGFDLDAVTAVAGEDAGATLGHIGKLVDQSLLRRDDGSHDGGRFAMLETVREYALDRLRDGGEEEGEREAHAAYFLDLAERIEATIYYSGEMRCCLDRLEADHQNCRAALATFVAAGDAPRELRLAGMLAEYWFYRGSMIEGIAALQGAVDRGRIAPAGPRAKALMELAYLYWATSDVERALALSETSIALARQVGNTHRLTQALFIRGNIVFADEGRLDEAIALLQESVDLTHGHDPPLENEQSAMAMLGSAWLRAGQRSRGVALVEEALTLHRASGRLLETGFALLMLGRLDCEDGDARRAAERYRESLAALRDAGVVTQVGIALTELADLVASERHPEVAARVLGMIAAIRERTGTTLAGDSNAVHARVDRHVRDALGDARHAALSDAGRNLSLDAALAEAIAIADALATSATLPGAAEPSARTSTVGLSAREREVLALLALRWTDPEIAERLFLSVRTVERHVSNIYNKLGVNSRRDAAAVAARHGLV